jgi:hypothetical protein
VIGNGSIGCDGSEKAQGEDRAYDSADACCHYHYQHKCVTPHMISVIREINSKFQIPNSKCKDFRFKDAGQMAGRVGVKWGGWSVDKVRDNFKNNCTA